MKSFSSFCRLNVQRNIIFSSSDSTIYVCKEDFFEFFKLYLRHTWSFHALLLTHTTTQFSAVFPFGSPKYHGANSPSSVSPAAPSTYLPSEGASHQPPQKRTSAPADLP